MDRIHDTGTGDHAQAMVQEDGDQAQAGATGPGAEGPMAYRGVVLEMQAHTVRLHVPCG